MDNEGRIFSTFYFLIVNYKNGNDKLNKVCYHNFAKLLGELVYAKTNSRDNSKWK